MAVINASDGVTLAVHRYTDIDPARPTVLAIHGYPDNHHVWDGVAELLCGRYNVVAYDVRGAGEQASASTDTRELILDAAYACFRKHGLLKTTIVDISREANVSRS
ncbi:TetR/AcrR family transcriptional regulator, partial [Mycobacterium gordonae]|uniref:TetR/AcrR family transcriptional regulator n=1 Tax=Mycobacterium gordonae TaxID=1778 RepID=UPI000A4D44E2